MKELNKDSLWSVMTKGEPQHTCLNCVYWDKSKTVYNSDGECIHIHDTRIHGCNDTTKYPNEHNDHDYWKWNGEHNLEDGY